ncbi:MAG: glycosyltransferase [Oscillospiraceae bacterium]|nr:glycosyltransferase [Oscillospiraceae bacterium]
MKICYVTTVPITLEAFVLPTLRYIHEHTDWEICVMSDEDPEFAQRLPEYIRYLPVSMKRGISLSGIGAIAKMVKIFRREKFDLVQYSTPNASLYASMAAKMAGIPVRLYCQWGMAFVGFSGWKRGVFKTIEKLVCRLSTWVEPDSLGNLKFSHQEGLYPEDKGSVVWNGSASGVNLEKFDISQKEVWRGKIRSQYGIPENAFVYGFIGRITGEKGINELFAAYRRIAQDRDAYLMLVGFMEKADSVDAQLYEWAQNQEKILFCDYTKVVEQYMATMDVYILPSYREGFGSAVVEAEAMGVPVIVSDIPGPTDAMVRDRTGLVVKKADVDSLYEAMLRMKDDDDLRTRCGEEARKFARENFEQQQLFAHILEDRKRLLAGRR